MIHQLAENGTAAIVLPHGVLFRGAAEGKIREYIIKDLNYLDAVIGLPANLFYPTVNHVRLPKGLDGKYNHYY